MNHDGQRPDTRTGTPCAAGWHPQVHEALATHVIPRLIQDARSESPLRIWVPSCSAAEHAYALAICLFEEFRKAGREPYFRIFATDSDETLLARARAGHCDETAASQLPADLLHSYFHRNSAPSCRVNDLLRSALVFGVHDIVNEPPIFSNLDLISLRNVPETFPAERLSHLIGRLHFALRGTGWLELCPGRAFTVAADLFEPVSIERALYKKRKPQGAMQPVEPRSQIAFTVRKAQLEKELRTANSAIESMTEELEVTNRMLRDSNAELRSINEELVVFNSELQLRVRSLNETNADLTTLINLIGVAVVFLDANLRIRRFSPNAAQLLGLTPGNVGQTVSMVESEFVERDLADEVGRAVSTASASETEIPCSGGRWYLRRVLPILESEGAPGAVVTWIDITHTKALHQEVLNVADLEQQRIGRELHDDIQQELAGLSLLGQSINENWESVKANGARKLIDRLVDGIARTNRRVRLLAQGLVPIPVDADSLVPALARLARSTQESSGIICELEQSGTFTMEDREAASHLYRIAQEAVRNAVRHSKANKIAVRLHSRDDDLLLEITDNGIGIGPRSQMHHGMGVRLMEHRCSLIGGRFSAERQAAGGTRVSCRVPTKVLHSAH